MTPRQTISTLPSGFAGSNFCSGILVSPDGRFLYAGNRLHDSIAIFSIGPAMALTYVGEEADPRQLSAQLQLRSDGTVPVLLQPRGDNVTTFRIDGKRAARFHGAVHGGGESVEYRVSGSRLPMKLLNISLALLLSVVSARDVPTQFPDHDDGLYSGKEPNEIAGQRKSALVLWS